MKKSHRQSILLGVIFVVTLSALFLLRAWRMSSLDEQLSNQLGGSSSLSEIIEINDEQYLVHPSQIYTTVTLPTLTSPQFDTMRTADTYLADTIEGIDIEVAGEHRFYSHQILNLHGVVHDSFNGADLTITHSSLCDSSAVYLSQLEQETLDIEASGNIFNNNLLLKSKDGSMWLQLSGLAISGSHIEQQLDTYPFKVMTWDSWKYLYPSGFALSNRTGYTLDYAMHPYQDYEISNAIHYPLSVSIESMNAKTNIVGVKIDGESIVFELEGLQEEAFVYGQIDDTPIVGFWDDESQISNFYIAKANEINLTFSYNKTQNLITDNQTGSRWTSEGLSIDGELSGVQLTSIQSQNALWMCWTSQYQDAIIANLGN